MGRAEYLVYIRVDEDNNIRYVGRGTHARAMSHGEEDWTTLVVDCKTEHAMKVAESVLISALMEYNTDKPLENKKLEEYRFEPSRVPALFADRPALPVLDPHMVAKEVGGPVLYVYIDDWKESPYSHHYVIDPLRPDATAIANRVEGGWAVNPWLEGWRENPESAPLAVIGLGGFTHNRHIVGALDLSSAKWSEPVGGKGTPVTLPWAKVGQPASDGDIDAYGLCGRRFTGVTFARGRASNVRLHDREGNQVPRP